VGGRPCGGRHDEGPRMRRSCNRSACRRARRLRKLSLPPRVAVTASQARTGFAGLGYNLCKDAAAFKSKRAFLSRRAPGWGASEPAFSAQFFGNCHRTWWEVSSQYRDHSLSPSTEGQLPLRWLAINTVKSREGGAKCENPVLVQHLDTRARLNARASTTVS